MESREEKKLLNTLKSIDGTLKRIEQSLTHEAVKEAVSHALNGGEYMKSAIDSAIHDTSQ